MDFTKVRCMPNKALVRVIDTQGEEVSKTGIIATTRKRIVKQKDFYAAGGVFVQLEEMTEADDGYSSVFARTGEVVAVGTGGASWLKVGDTVILDFMADNQQGNVVLWECNEKVINLSANTEYYGSDVVDYASRQFSRDQITAKSGEIKNMSLIIAAIRGNEIIANDPYVILKHDDVEKMAVSAGGILQMEREDVISRKVLAVSEISTLKYGIEKNDTILVKELMTFNIVLGDKKLTAVNDSDVLMKL